MDNNTCCVDLHIGFPIPCGIVSRQMLCTAFQGTLVSVPLLPFGLTGHNYGPDALEFKPQRWLSGDAATAALLSNNGSAASPALAAEGLGAGAAAPPDPLTFFTGMRDCIGQNLAKLELQVVLATLLARFAFSPGPELAVELELAAATGQPVITAVHALAGAYLTLQPLSGHMMLKINQRGPRP